MMRLLFLEWALTSTGGGMERAMLEQCVQLRRLGHDVTLGYHDPGDLLPRYEEAGVRLVRMAHYSPARQTLLRDAVGLVGNMLHALPMKLDLVAANSYQSTFFPALLARAKTIPLVCHLRLNPPGGLTAPTRFGISQVSRFVAASDSVRALWAEWGIHPSAIDVVHEGVDVARFRPMDGARAAVREALGLSGGDFVIFSGGRIDRVKNLEGVLRIFAEVRRAEPRARLLIAGAPRSHESPAAGEAYVASLRALADSLRVANDVHWLGHRSDVPSLNNAADVVMLLGLIPEPFGLVTCEALACGRPMVTPRQGGSIDILTGEFSRLMFDPAKPQEAVGLILSLVDWQRRDPGFADRARAHILEHFDAETMGRRLERSLEAAVRAGPTRHGLSR